MTTTVRMLLVKALCEYSGESYNTVASRVDGLLKGLPTNQRLRYVSSIDDGFRDALMQEFRRLAGTLYRMTKEGTLPPWLLSLEGLRLMDGYIQSLSTR